MLRFGAVVFALTAVLQVPLDIAGTPDRIEAQGRNR